MTKLQKVFLWLGLGLFLIPEILWSPLGNFYFEFFSSSRSGGTYPFRLNWTNNSSYINYLVLIFLLQFIGSTISTFLLLRFPVKTNKKTLLFFIILASELFIPISLFALYFSFHFLK